MSAEDSSKASQKFLVFHKIEDLFAKLRWKS